jgi:hypothetical protein
MTAPTIVHNMDHEHAADIAWTPEHVQARLPALLEMIEPAWFLANPAGAEGWSLVCRFAAPPVDQGSPSAARVRFRAEGAPSERLVPGVVLRLFERSTRQYATVWILD